MLLNVLVSELEKAVGWSVDNGVRKVKMGTQHEELKREFTMLNRKQKTDKIWCKYKVTHLGVKSHLRWCALTDRSGTIFYNSSMQVFNAFLITKECIQCQKLLPKEWQTKQRRSLWCCELPVHLHPRLPAEGWFFISERNAAAGRGTGKAKKSFLKHQMGPTQGMSK